MGKRKKRIFFSKMGALNFLRSIFDIYWSYYSKVSKSFQNKTHLMSLDLKLSKELGTEGSPDFGDFWWWRRMRGGYEKNSDEKKIPFFIQPTTLKK